MKKAYRLLQIAGLLPEKECARAEAESVMAVSGRSAGSIQKSTVSERHSHGWVTE